MAGSVNAEFCGAGIVRPTCEKRPGPRLRPVTNVGSKKAKDGRYTAMGIETLGPGA